MISIILFNCGVVVQQMLLSNFKQVALSLCSSKQSEFFFLSSSQGQPVYHDAVITATKTNIIQCQNRITFTILLVIWFAHQVIQIYRLAIIYSTALYNL